MGDVIACHSCDLMVSVASVEHGQRACCPRCGEFLTHYRDDTYTHVLAYAISGLLLLGLANSYAFLSFAMGGLENIMTLRETPVALWENGMPEIALLVVLFIVVLPAAVLLMLAVLCLALKNGRYYSWLPQLTKSALLLQNWSMVEVFIIGVIVALVKLAGLATVELGVSFWAYIGFGICFILAISHLDRYQCWERIETLKTA